MVKDNSKRRKNRRGMVIDNLTRKPLDDCKLILEFVDADNSDFFTKKTKNRDSR